MKDQLYIGVVTRALCVSPEFLRRLEREGRIPAPRRDAAGRRLYTEADLALLKSIGIGNKPRRLKLAEDVSEVSS
jgi:DNA-binding transcriptional MerR regulator